MIELYFQDTRVDLKENFSVLMTYESFDTNNPSTVKNSYSKTITLPGTEKNNRLFGQLWNVNKVIYVGNESIGSNYNPHKKTDFYILNNGVIIESGYVELNSIIKSLGSIEYKVTLYGGIGSIFYNLNYTSTGNKKKLSDLWFRWNETKPSGIFQRYPSDDEISSMKYKENNEFLINKNPNNIGKILTNLVPTEIKPIKLYPNGNSFSTPYKVYLSDINQDICPIPLYSGYYDDFDSKSMLVNYPIEMVGEYSRDNWGLEEDLLTTFNTLFPKTRTEDDKTFGLFNYNVDDVTGSFMKIEMLRDLDPSESRIYNIDELNWGIKFSKLMHAITDFENISEDRKYTIDISESIRNSPYFKDTFLNLGKLYNEETSINKKYISQNNIELKYDNSNLGWDTPIQSTSIIIDDLDVNSFVLNISKNLKFINYQYGYSLPHAFTGWKEQPGAPALNNGESPTNITVTPETTINGPYGYLSSYVRIHQVPNAGTLTNKEIDQYWYGQCNLLQIYGLNNQLVKTILLVNYQAVVAETSDFEQRLGTDAYGNSQFEEIITESGFEKPSYISSDVTLTEAWILNDWYNYVRYYFGNITIDEVKLIYTDNTDLYNLVISKENYKNNPASIGQILVDYGVEITLDNYVSKIEINSFNLYEKLPYGGYPDYGICEGDTDYRSDWSNWTNIKNRVFNILYHNGRGFTLKNNKIDTWSFYEVDNGNKCIENYFYMSHNGEFYKYLYTLSNNTKNLLQIYYNDGYRNHYRIPSQCGYLYFSQGINVVTVSDDSTLHITKQNLMQNTESPYQYLIDAMKMFRWKLYDNGINAAGQHEYQLMTPTEYYLVNNDVFLEDKIDWSKSQELKHNVINVPNINLRLKDTNDSYVQYLYEKQHQTEYDQVTFRYNYEFNNDLKDYLDVIYPAVSLYNNLSPYYNQSALLPPLVNSDFKQTLYYNLLTDSETNEKQIFTNISNPNQNVEDSVAKICSFDKSNNYVDSTMNSLLFYSGVFNNVKRIRTTDNPITTSGEYYNKYQVWPNMMLNQSNNYLFSNMNSGDRTYIWDFNGNNYDNSYQCFTGNFSSTPLWIPFFSPIKYFDYDSNSKTWYPTNSSTLYSLTMSNNDFISANLSETPFVQSTQDVIDDVTGIRLNILLKNRSNYLIFKNLKVPKTSIGGIYSRCYQSFMEDAYSDNAKKVTLWCQLPDIPKTAMRKFYIFDNSYWVITKIYDYDITSTNEQFVKVDFLQVQNKSNYVSYNI